MKNKKIKIIYILTGLHTGGAEVLLRDFLKKLDKDRFDPLVVSIVPGGEIAQEISRAGIKVVSLDIKKKWNFFSLFFKFRKIVKKEKPDLIHAHLFHACIVSRFIKIFYKNIIIVSTIHNESFGPKIRDFIMRFTDRWSDFNIAVSQKVAQVMISKKVVPKNKIETIYNGIDLEKFSPSLIDYKQEILPEFNLSTQTFLFLSIGRLSSAKGYNFLLSAFAEVLKKNPDSALIILGEGAERKNLEKIKKEKGLEGSVFFPGVKSKVVKYLRAADLFVLPSLWEGLPTVILEAMACQLPVIATRVGGVEEIIENKESGFLVSPQNSEELKDKLSHFLNLTEEERKKMGKKGRKIIEEKFSLALMVRNQEKLYLRLWNQEK